MTTVKYTHYCWRDCTMQNDTDGDAGYDLQNTLSSFIKKRMEKKERICATFEPKNKKNIANAKMMNLYICIHKTAVTLFFLWLNIR